MNKRLRVFWNSNAPWSTSGYGQAMADLLPLIRDEGYPVAISDYFGLQGGKIMLDGILQYPIQDHIYGSDALLNHSHDFKADVEFSLQDIWILNPADLQKLSHWIPWIPVDHDPIPKGVIGNLRFAYRIISMSKFGQNELTRNGFSSTYIPHTVNTEIFKPLNRDELRKQQNISPDAFLVGMVAANKENPPRKSFQEVLDAFKLFLEKVPTALLYIHSDPGFPGGFNFKQYADFIGVGDKLAFPDKYIQNFNTGKEQMAMIYNTFDVLVAPSISEGFGIPIIEAQSCGVPAIVNNFTSMPELIRNHITGEVCELAYRRFAPQGSYFGIPAVSSLHDCLNKIYHSDRKERARQSRKWIIEQYDLKTIFDKSWKPYLQNLEAEFYPPIDKSTPAIT